MENNKRTLLTRRQVIQNGVVLGGVSFAMPALAQDANRRWTIGNDRVNRTMVFKPGAGFYTESFTDLATGAHLISPDNLRMSMASEFSFDCNGRSYSGTKSPFEVLDVHPAKTENGDSLMIRLRLQEIGL